MISVDLIVLIKFILILGIVGFGYLQYKVSKLEEQVKALSIFAKETVDSMNEVIEVLNDVSTIINESIIEENE